MIYKTVYLTQKCSVIILAEEAYQGGIISKLDEGRFELCDLQSDVYSENRNGADTVPWGAPVLEKITFKILDWPILMYCERLVRYSSVNESVHLTAKMFSYRING